MKTKQQIQERRDGLVRELEAMRTNVHATEGAIRMCDIFLTEIEEAEKAATADLQDPIADYGILLEQQRQQAA